MVSSNSKYDKVMRGEASFILPEQLGYDIFKKKCVSCHAEPMFTDYTFRNTGLRADRALKRYWKGEDHRQSDDSLKFKVPSLRNVGMTFPYGHDGRFFSLLSVFEHYRKNMVVGPHTDPLLKKNSFVQFRDRADNRVSLYINRFQFFKRSAFSPPGFENNGKAPVDIHP
jgi:cytochrome c peroxidase